MASSILLLPHKPLIQPSHIQSHCARLNLRANSKCVYQFGKTRSCGRSLTVRAASQVDASPEPSTLVDKQIVTDSEFSIGKVSFGVVGLIAGTSLLSYGFGAYFNILPGSEWSALMLTYGFPLAIIGMALKYAELKPVSCISYSDAVKLRETKATPVLNQAGGIQRRNAPRLNMIREEVTTEGNYSLALVFESKALQLTDFEQRQAKFASFFGPGITAQVGEGGENLYEVRLISEGTTQPAT
ncbi:uncharacterized protein LOC131060162 isoform X3 [Cryptomeria japonica]|uniref:uncharacterized protein LOC131060162 isoform X3 n=1 Tax=Cryptomeria japonica TaxID=3369 RepID=UPI0027DA090C|nr:uncharacterized protein LOC131060162 isoform X3 [Cryptomeria japonica]